MTRKGGVWVAMIVLAGVMAEPAWRQVSAVPRGAALSAEETKIHARALEKMSVARQTCANDDCSLFVEWSGYCVRVEEHDPSQELMAQLKGLPAPARPASSCLVPAKVADRRLPQKDHLLLWARKPHWLSGGLVQVEAGEHLGDMAATGHRLTMARAWGRWWILRSRLEFIS
jgi:hypothetical protein